MYSYAMTLLEMLLGAAPWSRELANSTDLTVAKLAYKVVHDSGRPGIPAGVPVLVRTLIIECWEQDPKVRVDMAAVVDQLAQTTAHHDDRQRARLFEPGKEPEDTSHVDDFTPLVEAVGLAKRRARSSQQRDLDSETRSMAFHAAVRTRALPPSSWES